MIALRIGFPYVVVALVLVVLVGCAPTSPRTVGLADLVADAEGYDGDVVRTSGTVLEFTEDDGALERHFVLADVDDHRVELVPHDAVEAHIGEAVRVTGTFTFDLDVGRVIEVDDIEPLAADA